MSRHELPELAPNCSLSSRPPLSADSPSLVRARLSLGPRPPSRFRAGGQGGGCVRRVTTPGPGRRGRRGPDGGRRGVPPVLPPVSHVSSHCPTSSHRPVPSQRPQPAAAAPRPASRPLKATPPPCGPRLSPPSCSSSLCCDAYHRPRETMS